MGVNNYKIYNEEDTANCHNNKFCQTNANRHSGV
jgi:hypothetical protein